MKSRLLRIVPWVITLAAFYFLLRDLDWGDFFAHFSAANPLWICSAILLTILSYLLRSRRWQFLFPSKVINYLQSTKVLFLGFFMNNILPARTGEFVRAHMGARVTGEKRTLVLATIASERLADGLMLSLMFVLFSLNSGDRYISDNLFYVAIFFGAALLGVLLMLYFRESVFATATRLQKKFNRKTTDYTFDRLQVFINGLLPIITWSRLPMLILSTVVVWSVELGVYISISKAYGANLSLAHSILFLVTVNFSSLIPAAPGGLGVIEAVTTAALASIGLEKSHALSMVFSQHMIQYAVVGIPGIFIMLYWRSSIQEIKKLDSEDE